MLTGLFIALNGASPTSGSHTGQVHAQRIGHAQELIACARPTSIPAWRTTPVIRYLPQPPPVRADVQFQPLSAAAEGRSRAESHALERPARTAPCRRQRRRAHDAHTIRCDAQPGDGPRMYSMVHRAATADGADKSGLTAPDLAVVANFAVDSAMGVALANTLFFAAASGESKGKVALYLLITIAPFAVIAPLIGPALDRVQHGRRAALALSFLLRTALAIVLIMNFDANTGELSVVVLYPARWG